MTVTSQAANTPSVLNPDHRPLPVVITGTIPRDDSTLELVRFLNEQSASGRIEVFYFADNDNSAPLLTRIAKGITREVNPLRVPEDLVVSSSVTAQGYEEYFKEVRFQLRYRGMQAIGVSFPMLTDVLPVNVSCKVSFSMDDISYNSFSRGKKFTAPVPFTGPICSINVTEAVEAIGPANLKEIHLLGSPDAKQLTVDKPAFRKRVALLLRDIDGRDHRDSYVDGLVQHLIGEVDSPLVTVRGTELLKTSGIPNALVNDTETLCDAVISSIKNEIGKDPEIEKAELTAAEIIQGAKDAAEQILGLAYKKESDIEHDAEREAQELRDAAIEAAQLIPQLPNMLAAPLATLLGEKLDTEEQLRAQEELNNEQRRIKQERDEQKRLEHAEQAEKEERVKIKDHCDSVESSLEAMRDIHIGNFQMAFDTQGFRKTRNNFVRIIDGLTRGEGVDIPSAQNLEDAINRSNLGYEPLSIEYAVSAITLSRFIENVKASSVGKKLKEFADQPFMETAIAQWDLDQEQLDRAVLRAFMTHAKDPKFDETDRKFIRTCDGVLGGEIAQSLSRSLIAHDKAVAFGEISEVVPDQPGQTDSTDVLIGQIESLVHDGHSHNGSQLEGTLEATLQEIEERAASDPIGPTIAPHTVADMTQALESAQQLVPMQRMMRSDGSIVDFPGR